MALFTNIETELKPYCSGVSLSLTIDAVAGSRDFIERNYIKPQLGKAQYDALDTAYANDSLTAEQEALLNAVMPCLAPLTMWHFAGANAAELGDAGQRERNAEDGGSTRLWVSKLQRDTFFEQGMQELDNLLAFLDENKADYSLWAESTAYAGLKETLLQTTSQCNTWVNINSSRRLFKALRPSVKKIEFLTIRRYIGAEMYTRLVNGIKSNDLTTEESTVLNLLQAAIANLAFADAALPIEAGTNGVYILSSAMSDSGDTTKTAPDSNELFKLKQAHQITGMQYLNEAVDYLNKTATNSILTQFYESTLYVDPTNTNYSNLKHNNGDLNTICAL